jgi:hypothetical protein
VSTPNKFAALDSDFLTALEVGDDECEGVIDGLRGHGFYFIVTETPLEELGDIVYKEQGIDAERCEHAQKTILSITNWGFLTPPLKDIERAVALQVADKLVSSLMPHGHINEGRVLAEAAFHKCRFLITRRNALLKANRNSTEVALINADLNSVVVVSPTDLNIALAAIKARGN